MNAQIKLTESHREFIRRCMAKAGYPASLARECRLNPTIFHNWDADNKTMSWGTLCCLVAYARRAGIVGPFFDPITLKEPPSSAASCGLDARTVEAAWMLQMLHQQTRDKIMDVIAAEFGRQTARERDGQAM